MRKPLIDRIPLLPGNHPTREHGMCAMELVAWLAGEDHTDHPACTCPVLSSVVRTFNDVVPDSVSRDRYVRPLVPRLIHTIVTPKLEVRRAFVALDCAVRFFAPLALAKHGVFTEAETLRRLDPIVDASGAARAAAALKPFGRPVHAAWWTAARAADRLPNRLWVSGVVHAAKATNSWQGMRRLVESMIDVGIEVPH